MGFDFLLYLLTKLRIELREMRQIFRKKMSNQIALKSQFYIELGLKCNKNYV